MLAVTPGVAGCDEAGRGPLAGPVVAAAVLLPLDFSLAGLNDSKKLDPVRRADLFDQILATAKCEIEFAFPDEIDRLNILRASLAAMSRAVNRLAPPECIVDGNQVPPNCPCPITTAVKGDSRFAAVATASILAKVTRDRYMVEQAAIYPQYGFDLHFGYPTPDHLAALRTHGPCPIHRRSFRPVADALLQGTLF